MPIITIHLSEQAWERLLQRAQREKATPEQVAQMAIEAKLREEKPQRNSAEEVLLNLPESVARLPRGSVQRVLTTLEQLQYRFPLEEPPLSREAIDAYLQAERDSWKNSDEE